eukprot:gnl/TRDRNA2_/TRDRNA2_86259_c0_seq1.p1 gnl/TRDRNA2_/TRDRNA2_86259_c0~~gnl/TRDRNA2_/TRDRNA2_86259_c0_seq1.p1  ORF type:complete len:169 (+),score=17.04 gnl/TRDRNA2_/TRDRNA2_86259_c0_seq1:86-592(+)
MRCFIALSFLHVFTAGTNVEDDYIYRQRGSTAPACEDCGDEVVLLRVTHEVNANPDEAMGRAQVTMMSPEMLRLALAHPGGADQLASKLNTSGMLQLINAMHTFDFFTGIVAPCVAGISSAFTVASLILWFCQYIFESFVHWIEVQAHFEEAASVIPGLVIAGPPANT